jgi:glycosyltransferase involved in cell wall biosynthesis
VALVALIAGGPDGIPRYAAALVQAIDEVAPEFPSLDIGVLAHPPALETFELRHLRRTGPGWLDRATAVTGPRRIAAEQLASLTSRADVLHFFDLTLPMISPGRRFVATVHDAAIVNDFVGERSWHKRVIAPAAVRRSTRLVAVSEFARQEAITHFAAAPDRVRVVHSGPGLTPAVGRPLVSTAAGPGPVTAARRPYVLYVGNLMAHKNLPFLIEAFARAPVNADLLIAGSWGAERAELDRLIDRSGAGERIRLTGRVTDAELDLLYRGAIALALPSVYEGFGFTALEALARGCPVLAADIPALREVLGDGARFARPDDQDAWVRAITDVCQDPQERTRLIAAGAVAVGRYAWQTTAREICALHVELGGRLRDARG